MSEEAKLQESIKKTQDLLGKYIKKPPLTEKLLKKPPFRFLHDIINAIIKETDFLKGLFNEEELKSSNITDKEGKIAYLTKLIDAMKLITGNELSVRPSKIVSGQEPIKTNELLQAIGKSLNRKISSTEAIEHYKKSMEKREKQKLKKSVEKIKKKSSSSSSPEEKPRKSQLSEEKSKKFQLSEEKQRKIQQFDEKLKKSTPSERSRSKERGKEKEEKLKKKNEEETLERKSQKDKSSQSSRKGKHLLTPKEPQMEYQEPKYEEFRSIEPSKDSTESIIEEKSQEETATIIIPPPSPTEVPKALENREKSEIIATKFTKPISKISETTEATSEFKNMTLLRPPSARPSSARPGAPKVRKGDFLINPNSLTQMGDINVIVENFYTKEDGKDDAEDMVIVQNSRTEENLIGNTDLLNKELTKEHGYLVAQILETQRELVNEENVEIIPNKVEIEWETGIKKDKDAVLREVDKLKGKIQSLTRTTNPLGKLMDFLQEDAEIMEKELWDWKCQFSDLREQLMVERNLMKESMKPLEESLKEIEGTIGGQMEKIFQTKANIMRNNKKIQKLLSGR